MNIRGTTARLRCGSQASSHLPASHSIAFPALLLMLLLAGLFFCLAPKTAQAQIPPTARDGTVELSAQTTLNSFTLNWQADPFATEYRILRKGPNDAAFVLQSTITTASNPPASASTSYTDNTVVSSNGSVDPYEYEVIKNAVTTNPPDANPTAYSGIGYIDAGYNLPLVENHGTILLVVDNTYVTDPTMSSRLTRLQQDLVGDGWTVVYHPVARDPGINNAGVPFDHGASVKALHTWIEGQYNAAPSSVKAVFLLGHVPVPYSGDINGGGTDPYDDGLSHSYHSGAWPADMYYGDVSPNADSAWTDTTVSDTTAADPRNHNIPGDGKFDQTSPPDPITLEVGRVDLSGMTAFPLGEEALLEQYLDKDHAYRQGIALSISAGLVYDGLPNFGGAPSTASGENFAGDAYENFSDFFGPYTDEASTNYFTDTTTGNFLWSYASGENSSDGANGSTAPYILPNVTPNGSQDFYTNNPHAAFNMLFGDYFGDWAFPNDLLRAPLADPTWGLTAIWAGEPYWFLQHMALGNEIGYSTVISQNNFNTSNTYTTTAGGYTSNNGIWTALMGDPTLKLQVVTPPSGVTAQAGANSSVQLNWTGSPDDDPSPDYGGYNVGYNVYVASSINGTWTKLNTALVTAPSFTDPGTVTGEPTGARVYQVRAVNEQTSESGTYQNQSEGAFLAFDPSNPPPSVSIVAPANYENPNGVTSSTGVVSFPFNRTNGAVFTAPATMTIEATATAGNGNSSIAGVDFYLDSTLVGSAVTAPYRYTITGNQALQPGQYTLTAVATDTLGNTATSQSVRLYVFTNNGVTGGDIVGGGAIGPGWNDLSQLTAIAPATTAPVAVTGSTVTLNVPAAQGGKFILQHSPIDTSPYTDVGWSFSISTGTTAGQNLLVTFPLHGRYRQQFVTGTLPPNRTFVFAADTAIVDETGATQLSGIFGLNGSINHQFDIDGFEIDALPGSAAQPFTINYLNLEQNARRYDTAPTVTIRAPVDGSSAATPTDLTLSADAADIDSNIAAVDFYDNGVFIGTGASLGPTNNSYSTYTLPLVNIPAGTHVYTAEAVSGLGNITTSASATLTVINTPDIGGLVTAPASANGAVAAQPVPSATVTVTNANGQVVATYTTGTPSAGPTGQQVNYLNVLDPGTYTVTASAPTYGTSAPVTVTIPQPAAGSTTGPGFQQVNITLPTPPTTLDGLVTDAATGNAVTGAIVTVTSPAASSTTRNPMAGTVVATFSTTATSTDPLGSQVNYLGALAAGTYVADATANGYGTSAPVYITVTGGVINTKNFRLPAAPSSLGGLVKDATGAAVSGATVSLLTSSGQPVTDGNGNPITYTTGITQTAPDGSAENYQAALAPGTYELQATTTNGASAITPVTVAATGFTRADLVLEPNLQSVSFGTGSTEPVISAGQPLTGTVTLTEPAPSGGTFVSLTINNTAAASIVYGVTVPAGQTTAQFTITANSVSTAVTETVTASLNGIQKTAQFVVDPVPVQALSFSPTTIAAGGTATGTVSLNASGNSVVAPTGGLVVSLASGSPAVTVPATVTIPAGKPSVTFTATGTNVATTTLAQITATAGTSSAQASLTVTPAALSALTVSPTAVIGNAGSTGTVTLTGPAPSGGLTISLQSSNTAAVTVPGTVTVAAGQTTATFPITTIPVSATSQATITALAAGVSQTATVTVNVVGFSLALNTSSVTAGTPVTGTITLGTAAPTATTVTLSSSNAAAATVPSTVTVAAGATTATFQIDTYQAATGISITATLSGQASSQSLTVTANSGQSYGVGWQLLSEPYDYTGQTPAEIFGFAGATLFAWSPLQLGYVQTPTAPADTVHPGQGYWVYFTQPEQVTAVGMPTSTSQPFTKSLLPGWNMIGDPFNATESVSSLTATVGSSVYTYANAGALLLALYSYTPGASGAVGSYSLMSSGSSLVPGQGYWLYATQSLTLTFPVPNSVVPPPPAP